MMKNVTANITQLLRNQFPAETFYFETVEDTALQSTPPDRCTKVMSTGGPSQPWTRYTTASLQILNRDISKPGAAKQAKDIFNFLHGRFGLDLPAALNVGGVDYDALKAAQIKAVQLPYCLGEDDAGRTSFTTNYQVIYEEI